MQYQDEVFDDLPFRTMEKGPLFHRWQLATGFGGIFLERQEFQPYRCSLILYGVRVFLWTDEDPHKVVTKARECLNSIRSGINEILPPPPPEPSRTLHYDR